MAAGAFMLPQIGEAQGENCSHDTGVSLNVSSPNNLVNLRSRPN